MIFISYSLSKKPYRYHLWRYDGCAENRILFNETTNQRFFIFFIIFYLLFDIIANYFSSYSSLYIFLPSNVFGFSMHIFLYFFQFVLFSYFFYSLHLRHRFQFVFLIFQSYLNYATLLFQRFWLFSVQLYRCISQYIKFTI